MHKPCELTDYIRAVRRHLGPGRAALREESGLRSAILAPHLWTPTLQLPKGPHRSRRTMPNVRSRRNESTSSHTQPKAGERAAVVVKHPALAPHKRRPLGSSYSLYGRSQGYDRNWVDAGTGTTPATVGLSIDSHQACFNSPNFFCTFTCRMTESPASLKP